MWTKNIWSAAGTIDHKKIIIRYQYFSAFITSLRLFVSKSTTELLEVRRRKKIEKEGRNQKIERRSRDVCRRAQCITRTDQNGITWSDIEESITD